ncbi:MAG TPA: hypothetical protein PK256_06050 [Verrucomicrobiota bacterium]|nr:hypothetical protein [Verrucomicrobiota bacterium]
MKLICPNKNCHHLVDWRDCECGKCGFSLSFLAISQHYVRRIGARIQPYRQMECPTCKRPIPLATTICPHLDCQEPITWEHAVEVVVEPKIEWLENSPKRASPAFCRRIQWLYALCSFALFMFMLSYAEKHKTPDFLSEMFLSFFYMVVLFFILSAAIPGLLFMFHEASPRTRMGFVFNLLTLPFVTQCAVQAFPTRAVLLAAGIVAVTVAFDLVIGIEKLLTDPSRNQERPFDIMADQGRTGRHE